jgi:hypothetical protein
LQTAQIEQRRTGQRIDQQIEVAATPSVPFRTEPNTPGLVAR